ncbi:MAG TPA: ABC transporter transmembrane domain-containing protein, partial [Symbiobacteriaceae bacterium]|nr:ABC transporter transmembrane domain-containing protein [Symbiobacteriaceae bacterium]
MHLPWVTRAAFRAAPLDAAGTLLAAVLGGLAPGITLLLSKRAVDAVVHSGTLRELITPLSWLAGVLVAGEAIQALRPLLGQRLYARVWPYLERQVLHKASALTLAQFDQSTTYDLLQRASKATGQNAYGVFEALPQGAANAVSLGSALAILLTGSPWLGLIGLAAIIPLAFVQTNNTGRSYRRNRELSGHWRYTDYLVGLLTEREPATELRAYQLPGFFVGRWKETYQAICRKIWQVDGFNWRDNELALLCQVLATAATLLLIGLRISRGQAGLGDAVALTGALTLLNSSSAQMAHIMGTLWSDLLPIGDLQLFLALPDEERPPDQGRPFPAPLRGPI